MELDVRTILFFFFLVTTFIVFLLSFYVIISKKKTWYLNTFLVGKVFLALALIGVSLRGFIPDFLSIGVSNSLIFIAMGLEMYSFICIDGKLRRNLAYTSTLFVLICSIIFIASINAPDSFRVMLAAIPGFIFAFSTGTNLVFFKRATKFNRLLGVFYWLLSSAYILRFTSMIDQQDFKFMVTPANSESVFFIVNALILVVGTIGFILILKEQQEFEILSKNKDLNELNVTKDKFFSIIAHDLRGPIGALNNMGKVLLDQHGELTTEDREELINAVNESSGIALDLLNNLLYWAQAESGQLKVNITKFRPTDLLSRAALIFREAARLKNISITVPSRSSVEANADMEMIDTVVRNLFSNAIKFTPENGLIEAGYEVLDEHLIVFVKDSGVGMDKEVQSKLFQLDSDHSTRGTNMESGSGLGLKLCKEFVEKNHGRIWVVSKPGYGSIFKFTLNRHLDGAEKSIKKKGTSNGNASISVVQDEAVIKT